MPLSAQMVEGIEENARDEIIPLMGFGLTFTEAKDMPAELRRIYLRLFREDRERQDRGFGLTYYPAVSHTG